MKLLLLLIVFTVSVSAEKPDLKKYSTSLDYAQVTNVLTTQQSDGSWCFGTTVRHNDEGWDHYADGWEVLDFAGNQLAYRLLSHPHVNEQPFTRSQCKISLPADIKKVIVHAKCNKHGYGGESKVVEIDVK